MRVQPEMGFIGPIPVTFMPTIFANAPIYASHRARKAKKAAKKMLALLVARLDQLNKCQKSIVAAMLVQDDLVRRATVLKEKIEKGQVPKPLRVDPGIRRAVGKRIVGAITLGGKKTVAVSSKGTVVAVKEGKSATVPVGTLITGVTI